jgi:hypothetical protein
MATMVIAEITVLAIPIVEAEKPRAQEIQNR